MRIIGAVTLVAVMGCGDDSRQAPKEASPDDGPADDAASIDAGFVPPPCAEARDGTTIRFREIGQVDPTGAVIATSPPGDPRLFVVEQRGAVRLFRDEVLQPTPFIDLSQDAGGPVIGALNPGDERGLLGMTFHPQYATNGHFFLYYTGAKNGDLHDFLVRCTTGADPDRADRASCVELLSFRDPYSNHQGGMLAFGTDGYLYLSTGDGGGGGDPFGYTQDLSSFHGKMLRLDVDAPANGKLYGIPADNPYAAGGGSPEIYMRGMRNPWRWSFDRATGDMWIGDVGSSLAEELNVLRPAEQRGANLGWSVYEGEHCCVTTPFRCERAAPAGSCAPAGFTFPKYTRVGDGWRAIIAGEVYRGSCFPDLVGWHYFSDWNHKRLLKARLLGDGTLEVVDLPFTIPNNPSSIHGDARGELYVTTTQGFVYRLEVAP